MVNGWLHMFVGSAVFSVPTTKKKKKLSFLSLKLQWLDYRRLMSEEDTRSASSMAIQKKHAGTEIIVSPPPQTFHLVPISEESFSLCPTLRGPQYFVCALL